MPRWSRLWRSEEGAELIEFALVFPTLLLVMLGIIDFGFLFQRYTVVTNAAREGARVAVLPEYGTGDVQARVTQYLDSAGGLTAVSTVGPAVSLPIGTTQCITVVPVTVEYEHEFLFAGPIVSLVSGGDFGTRTLRATSSMRSETPSSCP